MQTDHPVPPSPTRWLRRTGLVLYAVRMGLSMSGAAAIAEPPPAALPPGAVPAPSAPAKPAPAAGSFRVGEQGDIAELEVFGLPPARPHAIALAALRLGESVTSIGFPGMNIDSADGVDMKGLMSGGKDPAEVLQDTAGGSGGGRHV